jgi:hypothetical protein
MSTYEDTLMEVYLEVENKGIREEFEKQCKKMSSQDKHRYKTVAEKWEYALYRIKGGKSKK